MPKSKFEKFETANLARMDGALTALLRGAPSTVARVRSAVSKLEEMAERSKHAEDALEAAARYLVLLAEGLLRRSNHLRPNQLTVTAALAALRVLNSRSTDDDYGLLRDSAETCLEPRASMLMTIPDPETGEENADMVEVNDHLGSRFTFRDSEIVDQLNEGARSLLSKLRRNPRQMSSLFASFARVWIKLPPDAEAALKTSLEVLDPSEWSPSKLTRALLRAGGWNKRRIDSACGAESKRRHRAKSRVQGGR